MLVASAFLMQRFGADGVLDAIAAANILMLAMVVLLGVAIQVVRAERARRLLSPQGSVSLAQSYTAGVVGHGFGDLLPLAPGGPALRCLLIERFVGLPIAFSAGVFMLEGMLDGLGPFILVAYLVVAVSVPIWIHWMLLAALMQFGLFVVVPLLARHWSVRSKPSQMRSRRLERLVELGSEFASGIATMLTHGLRFILSTMGLSLLLTGLAALQMLLFLLAFGLTVSLSQFLLVLVSTLVVGSIPIKIPAAGTVAAVEVLQLTGIHGAGAAGYLLVSRVVFSTETTMLAIVLLAWCLFGKSRSITFTDVLSMTRRRTATVKVPASDY
jgi:uncharacterized protein (TIRG00374 family)